MATKNYSRGVPLGRMQGLGHRSQQEVARLLGVPVTTVQYYENSALRKLARDPVVRRLAAEQGVIAEGPTS